MTVNALKLANSNPYAVAYLKGDKDNPKLKGTVEFFPWATGSIIKLEIVGLPKGNLNNFFGFHIHANGVCEENKKFETAGAHYDMGMNMHPNHTGDLPMIYSNNGYAFMLYYTNRFKPDDIIGKSVIIHRMTDDMVTQPAGNSGTRIACGVVIKRRWMFA
ncbi:MAG: superoxide dismutase family protein [Clostridia bacterium]|nr:superoxide dismutase family protein [Clostridia bacterium]